MSLAWFALGFVVAANVAIGLSFAHDAAADVSLWNIYVVPYAGIAMLAVSTLVQVVGTLVQFVIKLTSSVISTGLSVVFGALALMMFAAVIPEPFVQTYFILEQEVARARESRTPATAAPKH